METVRKTHRPARVMGLAVGLVVLAVLAGTAPGTEAQRPRGHLAVPPRTFAATLNSVAVDARAGRVFVASGSSKANVPNTVRVLDARSGRVLRATVLGRPAGAVAVDEQTGRAFVASTAVHVLDATTGADLRTVPVGGYLLAVDARTGRVFVAGSAARLSMVDARSGALLGTVAVGRNAGALAIDEGTGRVFVGTDCLADCYGGSISVLDSRRGVVLHTIALPSGHFPIAAAVDARTARVFVVLALAGIVDSLKNVNVLDARSGALLRRVAVGGSPVAAAVDEQTGRVFVANNGYNDNTVSVLDARSGVLLRTVSVGLGPAELAVDARSGRVFVANFEDHTVSVLDATSGAVLHTIVVGPHPSALAVDEQTGRVFVVDPFFSGIISVLDATSGRVLRIVAGNKSTGH